jgi:DNA-binding helix-hairpin-helix protein with protein kinase domain
MTKRSSLPLEPKTVLLDSVSRPVALGQQFGRGGEGAVYEVDGQPSLLAKVYHKRPLPEEQVAKIQAMVSCWSNALETIAAWPKSILFDPVSRKPCGLLMTKMEGARQLHELYGTTNRRRHFPDAGWHHMVLAARNTAAAFQTLHSANIVVGDVNQGNLLVDKGMCVRMIDCDSFQLTAGSRTFNCPVGTPHFTPPELQSLKLREVVRTANHDRFGLAILIFHLLFVGRHPFAGRFRGMGDLSIEKAIAERRFAFSKDKAATLVDPPPASLLLDDLPPSVGALFERAFRSGESDTKGRPTPAEWVQELDALVKRRKNCSFDASHVYYSQLAECPWCRIEDSGGPTFFVQAGGGTIVSADRLAALDARIWDLPDVYFPDLPSQRMALPDMPTVRSKKQLPTANLPDMLSALMAASWVGCFAGAVLGQTAGGIVLAAGSVLSLALAATLVFGKKAKEVRKVRDEYENWLQNGLNTLAKRAQSLEYQYGVREQAFNRSHDEFQNEIQMYRTAAENIRDVIAQLQEVQKAEFLRQFLVRDYMRQINGLTVSDVTMMESFGMDTANDVDRMRLYGVPGLDPEIVMELLDWRRDVEQKFVFNPEHGITLASVGQTKDLAVRRFKIAQARKILAGAKQVETLADVGKADLARALAQFDAALEQWKAKAKQYRESQSGRSRLELFINRSPSFVIGLALGIPFVAMIVWLIRG